MVAVSSQTLLPPFREPGGRETERQVMNTFIGKSVLETVKQHLLAEVTVHTYTDIACDLL